MQQTSKYQFNLVDATDDFSPAPLNQNMEKVENALTALDVDLTEGLETVADVIATFSANLGSGGHTCRLAFGTYQGTGQYGQNHPNTIQVGFTPVLFFLDCLEQRKEHLIMVLRPMDDAGSLETYNIPFTWLDNGVRWYCAEGDGQQRNDSQNTYAYLILGYSAS